MAAQTRCALTKTAGSFASRNENLWIHAKLKLCLLVIQKPPFQAEEDIVRSDRVATSVLFENFDQEFEFQLRLRQSVIQNRTEADSSLLHQPRGAGSGYRSRNLGRLAPN